MLTGQLRPLLGVGVRTLPWPAILLSSRDTSTVTHAAEPTQTHTIPFGFYVPRAKLKGFELSKLSLRNWHSQKFTFAS